MSSNSVVDIKWPPILLVTDADNTLWDTDSIYADGQLELLIRIEKELGLKAKANDRLAFIRVVDQELARLCDYDLKYPPYLFVKAIALALTGIPPKIAAQQVIDNKAQVKLLVKTEMHEKWFINYIKNKIPQLRPGVMNGLKMLHHIGASIDVLTEGDKSKCHYLLGFYDLLRYVNKIIVGRKSTSLYRRIGKNNSKIKIMIGDQLDRDILLAKRAGYFTIYFAGGFRPVWIPKEEHVAPDYKISSFAEVPSIISTILNTYFSKTREKNEINCR